ncbi:hypothetical protein JRI60_08195 [Archangium violaceum]|uniref:hypothetical protein n=1 Tax=Archangium violaceum TaxID=83451 RepID=UPI00194F5F34|nr:hypothetical protein [Archangium violaceum]QRN98994.1 hypothetical protein JRI60_08195 [Archangium violaceum]
MITSVNPRSARYARALACMLTLAVVPGAQARVQEEADMPASESEGTESTPVTPSDPDTQEPLPWKTRFGVVAEAGAPEGLGLSALVQPMRRMRVTAGASRNRLGFGVRGGLTFIPFELFLSPRVDIGFGHYFKADYGALLSQLHGQSTPVATGIRELDYNQVTGSLGLEYSPSRYVTLFGAVGYSYWFASVRDVALFIRDEASTPGITAKPLAFSLTSPVAKLGLIIYFN